MLRQRIHRSLQLRSVFFELADQPRDKFLMSRARTLTLSNWSSDALFPNTALLHLRMQYFLFFDGKFGLLLSCAKSRNVGASIDRPFNSDLKRLAISNRIKETRNPGAVIYLYNQTLIWRNRAYRGTLGALVALLKVCVFRYLQPQILPCLMSRAARRVSGYLLGK